MQLCRTLSEGVGIVKGRRPAGDKNLMRDLRAGISQSVNGSTGQLVKEKIGGLRLAYGLCRGGWLITPKLNLKESSGSRLSFA
jgi:hypothetical protein